MIPVLITTNSDRRGIFVGYVPEGIDVEATLAKGIVTLFGFRNCIYFARSVGGVWGLAETGPNAECRIGKRVSTQATFDGVTAIAFCTATAAAAWEGAECVS